MYNQSATAPGLNYPRPKSITHLRPGVFYMMWDDSPDIHGSYSFMWYLSHERYTVSNVESPGIYTLKFGSTAGNRTRDSCTTRPTCLTTRLRLSIGSDLNTIRQPHKTSPWIYMGWNTASGLRRDVLTVLLTVQSYQTYAT